VIVFFKNIVCPACGAACDDIQVEFGMERLKLKMYVRLEIPVLRQLKVPKELDNPF